MVTVQDSSAKDERWLRKFWCRLYMLTFIASQCLFSIFCMNKSLSTNKLLCVIVTRNQTLYNLCLTKKKIQIFLSLISSGRIVPQNLWNTLFKKKCSEPSRRTLKWQIRRGKFSSVCAYTFRDEGRKERTREQGRKLEILDAWACHAIWAPWTKAIWSGTDCYRLLKAVRSQDFWDFSLFPVAGWKVNSKHILVMGWKLCVLNQGRQRVSSYLSIQSWKEI